MNRLTMIAVAALLALGGSVGSYLYGVHSGKAEARASQDAKAVKDLTAIIDAQRELITQANAASAAMNQAVANRQAADTQSTKDFKNALRLTASSRTGCVYDAGILQQLSTARARAAQAAASGLRQPLSQPRADIGGQR